MKYRLLGRSSVRVSQLCLGTMTFGQAADWGAGKDESRKVYDLFRETGGNFLDCANIYQAGESERILGEFIRPERHKVVIATKYSGSMDPADPNAGGNHRKNMVQAVEASLRRLGTDYIDLYYLHLWDQVTPLDEVMRAFDDLVRAGKVLHAGISDMPAWAIARAQTLAELRGWAQLTAIQVQYSLLERTPERELVPMAQSLDLAITNWSPLGMGRLADKLPVRGNGSKRLSSKDLAPDFKVLFANDRVHRIATELAAVATEMGCAPAQVALAWILQQPGGHIPIVGARSAKQLRENLGCLTVALAPEHLARLDEVSRTSLGFPHEFLRYPAMREYAHGANPDERLLYADRIPTVDASSASKPVRAVA
ncbi:MAG: aldo/keto reductase [Pseudomonadota bacterium]